MDTSSYIYKKGLSPESLRTVISSKHRVFSTPVSLDGRSGMSLIGNISQFNISENRTIEPVRGIGKGMRIAELVPGVVEPVGLSCQFFALYLANLMQIFGYNSGVDGFVRSLQHHQWPFDVRSEIILTKEAIGDKSASGSKISLGSGTMDAITDGSFLDLNGYNEQAIVTVYEACWMESWNMDTEQEGAVVTQGCEIKVTDILDGMYSAKYGAPTGNEPSKHGLGSLQSSLFDKIQNVFKAV